MHERLSPWGEGDVSSHWGRDEYTLAGCMHMHDDVSALPIESSKGLGDVGQR